MHAGSDGGCIGEYQLERLLGTGGAGLVFSARHVRIGHRVVIKLLRPDRVSSEQRARFLREGQALARLRHPGIVRMLHADTLADGTEYLVLERRAGVSLRELMLARGAPLTTAEAAGILAQAAAALSYAHGCGVVHRDLKPENLIVREDGDDDLGGLHVTLIDFGLAWQREPGRGTPAPWPVDLTQLDTQEGARPGTPYYRAPELGMDAAVESGGELDMRHSPALDAYALGVVGWELLSGLPPSRREPAAEVPQLRALRPDAPLELVALIGGLLAATPDARPDLAQVARCARTFARRSLQRPPLPAGPLGFLKKFAQRPPRVHLSMQMTAVLLTLAAGLAFFSHRRVPAVPPVLVLTQPELGALNDEQIRSTLTPQQVILKRVDIAPMRQLGPKVERSDWSELAAKQTQLVRTEILPALHGTPTPQLAYFGMAPVPLAIQLGSELGSLVPISVFQRTHKRPTWRWPSTVRTQEALITGLPQAVNHAARPVVLRVATSHRIEPALTRELVPAPLAEIDVMVSEPDPDALRSEQDVIEVAAAVRRALDEVVRHLPSATTVHLFAAVPGALALHIGMAISPTVHPPIQTYQFNRNQQPCYQPALLINARPTSLSPPEDSMPSAPAQIERRLENFVDWLKPDGETEAAMARQAHEIRERIRAQAATDKLIVRSTPAAGSFAKNTGLRRHVTGGSAVDGQDVDIPFVLGPMSEEEQRISRLLDRFQGYADRAYPQRPPNKSRTKSSIKIAFEGSKLSFDLVPMIQASEYGDDYQWLLRGDGSKRLTSINRHNTFISQRTAKSNQRPGRVKFNECVRLLKWWREFRMANDRRSIAGIPSILIEMLAAYAFDQKNVQATYSETLLSWFDFLHGVVQARKRISFGDYPPPRGRRHADKTPWMVIEPVDPENNLTHDWIDQHIDELAGWLMRGRDDMQRAIDLDRKNNPQESLHHLVRIFGTPFKHHCGG